MQQPAARHAAEEGRRGPDVEARAADYEKLVAGSFKVVIRGTAATAFAAKGAEANLQLTFTFAAFE